MRTLLLSAMIPLLSAAPSNEGQIQTFRNPIDAISVGVQSDEIDLEVSGLMNGKWTEWNTFEIEKEFDPTLRESNLVLFSEEVTAVRFRGTTENYLLHPIRISDAPVAYETAAVGSTATPRILTRAQWGADDSLLYRGTPTVRSDEPTDQGDNGGGSVSVREQECETAQLNYPDEFKTSKTVRQTGDGQYYRWPQSYSPSVKQLVVHHTAIKVRGDARTGTERTRALYEYHANSRGWGDIGYHYLVDEKGQIYEGRAGGDYVVGGHAYCNNVGTVGVALLGNFELEQPTQEQMRSLQWLLDHLAKKYDIDVSKSVKFHGKTMPAIVGHGDLVTTACPGYYVRETLEQVLAHVRTGDLFASIAFPQFTSKYSDRTSQRRASRLQNVTSGPHVEAVGSTDLLGRPNSSQSLRVVFKAGNATLTQRARIAAVTRSNNRIGIWQEFGGREIRVRNELLLPEDIRANGSQMIGLRIQFPTQEGNYTVDIGGVEYTLSTSGRRARTLTTEPVRQTFTPSTTRTSGRRVPVVNAAEPASTATIRIRLGYNEQAARIHSSVNPTVNGSVTTSDVDLSVQGDNCVASQNARAIASGIVRIEGGVHTVSSWVQSANRFRGVIECRVIDGQLALINELPLEEYIAGLAEEPDTEPYEKQRAFAIAARSYAAHYMQPENTKFPGMPYDGDDSPARFQKYGGVLFEENNPGWVRAAKSTAGKVIKKNGGIVKTAYFSQDDGRTRSPDEIGWKNFPFAEVFESKPDPWCNGLQMWGHGVGMSGCGAEGQANEGKTAEEILMYYYRGATIEAL